MHRAAALFEGSWAQKESRALKLVIWAEFRAEYSHQLRIRAAPDWTSAYEERERESAAAQRGPDGEDAPTSAAHLAKIFVHFLRTKCWRTCRWWSFYQRENIHPRVPRSWKFEFWRKIYAIVSAWLKYAIIFLVVWFNNWNTTYENIVSIRINNVRKSCDHLGNKTLTNLTHWQE